MLEVFHKANGIQISWDTDTKIVMSQWTGYIESEPYHTALNKIVELHTLKKSSLHLFDSREKRTSKPEDSDWVQNDWMPRLASAGVDKFAYILPQSFIAQISMKRVARNVHEFEINQFSDLQAARQWLLG